MSQYEQENDLGSGGGDVDEQAEREAWERSETGDERPQPWAKASASTESLAADEDDDD